MGKCTLSIAEMRVESGNGLVSRQMLGAGFEVS